MPTNNAYKRSVRREREWVNKLRKEGYDACRSAGSHSEWDVWGVNWKTRHSIYIQIKTEKGARKERKEQHTKIVFECHNTDNPCEEQWTIERFTYRYYK